MNQVSSRDIILAIKSDNLVLFADLFENCRNISLGRFPILSLCILYNAKKTIKKYKQQLLSVEKYEVIDEPREVYEKFKSYAGRVLRLYLHEDTTVSPIEMLAIMNQTRKLKKLYSKYSGNEDICRRLKAIFDINMQKCEIGASSMKVGRKPWSAYQRRLRLCALCMAIAFVCVLSGSFAFVGLSLGFGTEFNPFKVSTESQLLLALKSDGYYLLTEDIEVGNAVSGEFKGNLNGNGFSIFIDEIPDIGYLLENNSGTIENLKIEYTKQSVDISKSLSLFVANNFGILRNIEITCEELDIKCTKSGENDIYLSAFATSNSGNIEDSNLSWNVSLESTGDGECAVGGIVGKNIGTIDGCIVETGNVTASESDVAGIVCFNDNDGVVKNCKNYSNLKQNSESMSWNPNVGGIGVMNYGLIENSYNMGTLEVNSLYDEEESAGSLFVGGISSMNYGSINNCLSLGDIKSTSKRIVSYVGGISGYSYYKKINNQTYLPNITGCGVNNQIDVYSENEKSFVFAGGISGYLYGQMYDCYSLATFVNGNDDGKYLVGLAIGSSDVQYSIFTGTVVCINADNIYVLDVDNVLYQIASLRETTTGIWGNTSVELSYGIDATNAIHTSTLEEITSQGVYWNAE